jgi:hypothetical protein
VQQNTMRVENGPEAGRVFGVTPMADLMLKFQAAKDAAAANPNNDQNDRMMQRPQMVASAPPQQAPSQQMPNLDLSGQGGPRIMASGGNPQTMRVVGSGNGAVVDLGTEPAQPVSLDYTRGKIDIPGVGRGYYGKDGNAYVQNPDGSVTKALLGYDMEGSMALNKANLEQQKTRAEIAHTQEATRASQVNNPDFSGTGSPGVTGDAAMAQLDPGTAATVRAMLEGRMQPPGQMALRNPRVLQLINLANQIDPTFDATTWTQRYKTAQDFSSGGKSGQALTSYSTLLDHINNVAKTGAALNNFSGFPFANDVNDLVNNIEGRSGDPRVAAAVAAKTNFDNELAKAMASGHITDASVGKQAATLSLGMPDAQREAAIKEIVSLLGSKINETGNAYIRGMGKTGLNPADLLTPGAKATYLRYMGVDAPTGTLMNAPAQAASAASAPQVGEVRKGYMYRGGDPSNPTSWMKQ